MSNPVSRAYGVTGSDAILRERNESRVDYFTVHIVARVWEKLNVVLQPTT